MKNTGVNYPFNDVKILKINSPRESLKGPYTMVFKNIQVRWAIVAFDWEGESLSKNILSGLPIDHKFSGRIEDFLCGKIKGEDLSI